MVVYICSNHDPKSQEGAVTAVQSSLKNKLKTTVKLFFWRTKGYVKVAYKKAMIPNSNSNAFTTVCKNEAERNKFKDYIYRVNSSEANNE